MEEINPDSQNLGLYQTGGKSTTVFDRITSYIDKKYKICYNETALVFEIRSEKVEWTELNLNSLFIELSQAGISTTLNKLEILMRSHLIPKYNPLEEYFKNLPKWDGNDHIVLDNDRSGKFCADSILKSFPEARDRSEIYETYKDLNEFLLAKIQNNQVKNLGSNELDWLKNRLI